jgi:hypothetical protein
MANKGAQNIDQNKLNTFIKGLNKDADPSFVSEGMWIHARNAVNNSREGDLGSLSNEPANKYCATAGETMLGVVHIIGAIYLYSDKWLIFTAAHGPLDMNPTTGSEIGLFEEELCRYRTIVQDDCLNFSKWDLITGSSREKEDCTWQAYWADGNNPDRYLNIGDPQTWPSDAYTWIGNNTYANSAGDTLQWPGVHWQQLCTDSAPVTQTSPGVWPVGHPVPGCITCVDTTQLDCNKIRLARLMETPCLHVSAGKAGGTLRNGSYFAVIAYAIKGQKVTDWFSPSNVQPLWFDNEPSGALEIDLTADNENFSEFILVVVSNINQTAVAKQIGIYSTSTTTIYLDQIKEDLPVVPIEQLPIQTPVYERSDQIVEVNNYLLRVGPTTKFDFNYQPLANLITSQWVSTEYPADYYIKGGHKPSYLRDEVYSFFIRWVYDTGDKSASYHIPGRAATFYEGCMGQSLLETALAPGADQNILFSPERVFEVYNTATTGIYPSYVPNATLNALGQWVLDDGGVILATGQMGYWESTEVYPDNRPDIWNSSEYCWTGVTDIAHDLCGKPIRHHKFPDHGLNQPGFTNLVQHYRKSTSSNEMFIRLMGVEFNNIIFPKDQDGNDIPDIVGYEILRGSREGNKSIIAKGMVNNMRPYKVPGNAGALSNSGLYPNHPFNTIKPPNTPDATDPYIIYDRADNESPIAPVVSQLAKNIITFHSPDTNFKNPFLSAVELKLYGSLQGISQQQFVEPNLHPRHKLIANLAMWMMIVGGVIEIIISQLGKRNIKQPGASYTRKFGPDYTQEDIGGGASGTENTNLVLVSGLTTGTSLANITYSNLTGNGGDTEEMEYTVTSDQNDFKDAAGVTGTGGFNNTFNDYLEGGAFDEALAGGDTLQSIYDQFNEDGGLLKGGTYTAPEYNTELSPFQYVKGAGFINNSLSVILAVAQSAHYFAEGSDITLKLIYALLPYRQYALQMLAHGFYDTFKPGMCAQGEPRRFNIADSFYLGDAIQNLKPYQSGIASAQYRINNLKRQTTVVVRTTTGAGLNDGPAFITDLTTVTGYADTSLTTIGTAKNTVLVPGYPIAPVSQGEQNKVKPYNAQIASHYAGLKYRIVNQYGQLDAIKQIPIGECEFKFDPLNLPVAGPVCGNPGVFQKKLPSTGPLFNGDTYINRYTEKNSMFFFYDWLYGQPNGYEFNYYTRQMIPEPRFKLNTETYESSNLWSPAIWLNPTSIGTGLLPNAYYKLDAERYDYTTDEVPALVPLLFPFNEYPLVDGYEGLFGVKNAYTYLATSAVRDFFVESDVIVDFREPGVEQWQKAYNPYTFTDLTSMFDMNPDIITRGNWYRYDYSLSISKLFTQYFSQGNLQSRYYNPNVSKLCYVYNPDRIIHSLPQINESIKDSWFVYLANNYVEFKDQISGVKNFAKTGIFITFKNSSPLVYQGVDQLETTSGTKLTIGDGGLFSQTPQSIVIADRPYEYGASQNIRSVISTPAGLYYISQNQGKIHTYASGLSEISQSGLKWWFNEFLPYKLLDAFPDYPHVDNPVAGIGCHSIYDNENSILYFSKKDYQIKPEFAIRIKYDPNTNYFYIDDAKTIIKLGDPLYFDDASWTISYDPKNKFWLSYHDWHPDFFIPTKNTFLTTKNNDIWRHNDTCNLFCNYYGVDYPFEIEFPVIGGQTVTTTRSIEYILECYRKSQLNCIDQFHVLDYNFDQAVFYNTEQVSGYLNLNIFPKNNITLSLQYPTINLNSIDILFSKEENKYRFNQFWDITKDRGEFPVGSDYPPTGPVIPGTTVLQGPYDNQLMWLTEPNGYIKSLNLSNLDYQKSELQRKKFRHYINFLNLSRSVSGDVNMILKIVNSKNIISPR